MAANTYRAVSQTTGIKVETLLETVATIEYDIGTHTKVFEITMLPQFSDGDDTVIFGGDKMMGVISKNIDEKLSTAGKIIKSSTSSGCTVVDNFWELSFCSHTYECVLVGKDAQFIHAPINYLLRMPNDGSYKVFHLPTRPTSEVLGKLRASLKQTSQVWREDDPTALELELNRSKIISALLQYPTYEADKIFLLNCLNVFGRWDNRVGRAKTKIPRPKTYTR